MQRCNLHIPSFKGGVQKNFVDGIDDAGVLSTVNKGRIWCWGCGCANMQLYRAERGDSKSPREQVPGSYRQMLGLPCADVASGVGYSQLHLRSENSELFFLPSADSAQPRCKPRDGMHIETCSMRELQCDGCQIRDGESCTKRVSEC